MYYFLITIQEEYIFSHILMKKRINRMTLSTLEACRQSCGTKTHIGNAQSRIHHHCRYEWKKTHLTPTKTLGWKTNAVLSKVLLSHGGWMMDSSRLFARRHNSKFNCGPSKQQSKLCSADSLLSVWCMNSINLIGSPADLLDVHK